MKKDSLFYPLNIKLKYEMFCITIHYNKNDFSYRKALFRIIKKKKSTF